MKEEGLKVTTPPLPALAVLVTVVPSPQLMVAVIESPELGAVQLESVAVTLTPICANVGAVNVQVGGAIAVTVIGTENDFKGSV